MQFQNHNVDIWVTSLALTKEQEHAARLLLSHDELDRADRFMSAVHRARFTAARATLRRLISMYVQTPPHELSFNYGEHKKPSLAHPNSYELEFNLSHSEDIALYAFTKSHPLGIDIEKIRASFDPALAKRFFSSLEYDSLLHLPEREQNDSFYRIWSRKEALIKAVGKGLSIPLASFSVSPAPVTELIEYDQTQWRLIPLEIDSQFQASLACHPTVKTVTQWKFFDQPPQMLNVTHI